MVRRAIVLTIRTVFRHPLLTAVGVIFVVGCLVVLSGGSGPSTHPTPRSSAHPSPVAPASPQGPASLTPEAPPPSESVHPYQKHYYYGGVPPASSTSSTNNPYAPPPDPADVSPESRGQAAQAKAADPALQFLPFDSQGVSADITDQAPDGRLTITISYRGSQRHAESVWRHFLRQHLDTGAGYLAIFVKAG